MKLLIGVCLLALAVAYSQLVDYNHDGIADAVVNTGYGHHAYPAHHAYGGAHLVSQPITRIMATQPIMPGEDMLSQPSPETHGAMDSLSSQPTTEMIAHQMMPRRTIQPTPRRMMLPADASNIVKNFVKSVTMVLST